MTELEKLKKSNDLSDLATLLGYKPKTLSYILYKIPDKDKYVEFSIPKKNGGLRHIKAPIEKLKHLQGRLADHLSKCYEELCEEQKKDDKLSHGFRKNRSIITNASRHKNRRYVFNTDLQNFFPSINFGRVRGFFITNNRFKLNTHVATIIAQIACHDNELPQGSPCSPVISNLIGHHLDIRLSALSAKAMCTYTRYADDLTFSTNRNELSNLIAKNDSADDSWAVGKKLRKEIESAGFSINDGKTSMQFKTSRQIVTGLVVNKKVNIKQEYYRLARSMCHSLFLMDEFYISKKSVPTTASTCTTVSVVSTTPEVSDTSAASTAKAETIKVKGTLNQLEGMLCYIYQIKGLHDKRDSTDKKNFPLPAMALYRKFLFYKNFFALNKPLIVCEGKTDNIYLRCAIQQLGYSFTKLKVKTGEGDSPEIGFQHMSDNFKEIMAMSGGTGGMASFMSRYEEYMKPFKGSGKQHPVILLVDNDSGSKPIKDIVKSYNPSKLFYHFKENLYVVFTPLAEDGSDTAIETLFAPSTLATLVDGKKFNKDAKLDPASEYGKTVFANKVIKANQKSINFDGFKEVLNRVKESIVDYEKKLSEPVVIETEEVPKTVKKKKSKTIAKTA